MIFVFSQKKIEDFLHDTASKNPLVPSGGSVLALCAALSAALTELVANTTIDKKGYEDTYKEMKEIAEKLRYYRSEFTKEIDKDAIAYGSVVEAYRLPTSTENEKKARSIEIERAYKKSVEIPLKLAQSTVELLNIINTTMKKGNKNAYGDAYTASLIGKAVVMGSLSNSRHNLSHIKDKTFIKESIEKAKEIEEELNTIQEIKFL